VLKIDIDFPLNFCTCLYLLHKSAFALGKALSFFVEECGKIGFSAFTTDQNLTLDKVFFHLYQLIE
jgi:hypothetical protein